jgi:hypothetical protein
LDAESKKSLSNLSINQVTNSRDESEVEPDIIESDENIKLPLMKYGSESNESPFDNGHIPRSQS